MKAKELKELITEDQIIHIMHHLGADSKPGGNDNEICFKTICHGGDSHKLYFYRDSKHFHCYSNCGHMDIINIVQNVLDISVTSAISYICDMFGFSNGDMKEGFSMIMDQTDDWQTLNDHCKEYDEHGVREFNVIDDKILEQYYDYYHSSFYNDGISIATLQKFGIKYDILEQRVIIPHHNEKGELIAIRCRNLDQDLIDSGRKYMPIIHKGKLLSAKTNSYLYGLYYNQDNIRRMKSVVLLESEKAVMQLDTILGKNNIGVALSSSNLSDTQVLLLKELGVTEVIVALDKEYKKYNTVEEKIYAMKIRKGIINKLSRYFSVSVMWDIEDLLDYKDSPTDKGSDVYFKLFNNRLKVEGN